MLFIRKSQRAGFTSLRRIPIDQYRLESSQPATILDCGGRAKRPACRSLGAGRRHRFRDSGKRCQSGVALRFPPHSKNFACGVAALRSGADFPSVRRPSAPGRRKKPHGPPGGTRRHSRWEIRAAGTSALSGRCGAVCRRDGRRRVSGAGDGVGTSTHRQ